MAPKRLNRERLTGGVVHLDVAKRLAKLSALIRRAKKST